MMSARNKEMVRESYAVYLKRYTDRGGFTTASSEEAAMWHTCLFHAISETAFRKAMLTKEQVREEYRRRLKLYKGQTLWTEDRCRRTAREWIMVQHDLTEAELMDFLTRD